MRLVDGYENSHDKGATVEGALWQKKVLCALRPMEKSRRAAEETTRTTMSIQKRWWGRLVFVSYMCGKNLYDI